MLAEPLANLETSEHHVGAAVRGGEDLHRALGHHVERVVVLPLVQDQVAEAPGFVREEGRRPEQSAAPEPDADEPLIVTVADDWPAATLEFADTGAAGGGAKSWATSKP